MGGIALIPDFLLHASSTDKRTNIWIVHSLFVTGAAWAASVPVMSYYVFVMYPPRLGAGFESLSWMLIAVYTGVFALYMDRLGRSLGRSLGPLQSCARLIEASQNRRLELHSGLRVSCMVSSTILCFCTL